VVMLVGGYANLLLTVVQGLVLVPLYLRYLGPTAYGAWMASGDLLGWLAVLDMGIAGISSQRMAAAHGRGENRVVADYFGTGLAIQAVLVALLTVVAVAAAPAIPGVVRAGGAGAEELAGAFALAGVATGLGLMGNLVGALAVAAQRMVFVNVAIFASGVVSIAATVGLLLTGHGLYALAGGMLVRNGLMLAAVAGHAVYVLRYDLGERLRFRWAVARDFSALSAIAVLTMVGNTAVARSDALLVALFHGPRTVTIYVLTRRAAELLSLFLGRIGGAVYPGFAHLVGSGDRVRAAEVMGQVARLYLWTAVPAVALYMALNRSFVALWVGPAEFAGQGLTVLIGLNALFVGWAALVLYLTGAAGQIARAGLTVFAEAVVRIVLAVALLATVGLLGLPLAGVVTTLASAALALGWLYRRIGAPVPRFRPLPAAVAAAMLAMGALGGTIRWGESWGGFFSWGAVFFVCALGVVLAAEPAAWTAVRGVLRRALDRPRSADP
jgi:O-antigen/teichoic acid export membrane protein